MKNFFKKVKWNRVIFLAMSLIVAIFLVFIGTANILPIKYYLVLTGVFVLWLVLLFFLLVFKIKPGKNKKRKIAGYIVSALLIAIMGAVFYYLKSTLDFIHQFGDNKYKEENYLVLVLNDSSYQKIEDLENKQIGYVDNELGKINNALQELTNKTPMETKKYTQYDSVINDLKNKNIDSMLVEESYLSILEENGYSGIFRTVYTVTIRTEISSISKEVDVTNSPFTFYISGIDSYGSISGVSRSDVNMIVTVNPKTKQILLVSTPRDYYVQLRGTSGMKDKLTHAGIYGIETSIGTLEDLLETDVNYYFRVNFTTVEKVVNALDGIDVYSQYNFTSSQESGGMYRFTKGYNHMNGKQALSFSRERHNVTGGDRTRGINQQAVIDGLVRKATSSAILTKYNKLLSELKNTFQTNMTEKDILKLVKKQINDMATWNITSYSLDGTDGNEYTYSYQHQKLYVMKPNMDTVSTAIGLIDKVIAGEKLNSSYGEVGDIHNPGTVTPKPTPNPTPEEPTKPETPAEPDTPEEKDPETPVVPDDGKDPLTPILPDDGKDPEKPTEPDTPTDPGQVVPPVDDEKTDTTPKV